jgi:hypothetical protein
MRSFWIGLFLLGVFPAVLACRCCLSVDWTPADETSRSDVMDEQIRYLHWCNEWRYRVIEAVVSEQMTLLEAAATFAILEAERPPTLTPPYVTFAGRTVEEKLCRHVIRRVETQLWKDPRQAVVVKRLNDELDAHLARGPLRLPEVPSDRVPSRSWR